MSHHYKCHNFCVWGRIFKILFVYWKLFSFRKSLTISKLILYQSQMSRAYLVEYCEDVFASFFVSCHFNFLVFTVVLYSTPWHRRALFPINKWHTSTSLKLHFEVRSRQKRKLHIQLKKEFNNAWNSASIFKIIFSLFKGTETNSFFLQFCAWNMDNSPWHHFLFEKKLWKHFGNQGWSNE